MIAPAIAPRDPDAIQRQPGNIALAEAMCSPVPANDRVARHGGNMNGQGSTSTRTSTQNVWRTS